MSAISAASVSTASEVTSATAMPTVIQQMCQDPKTLQQFKDTYGETVGKAKYSHVQEDTEFLKKMGITHIEIADACEKILKIVNYCRMYRDFVCYKKIGEEATDKNALDLLINQMGTELLTAASNKPQNNCVSLRTQGKEITFQVFSGDYFELYGDNGKKELSLESQEISKHKLLSVITQAFKDKPIIWVHETPFNGEVGYTLTNLLTGEECLFNPLQLVFIRAIGDYRNPFVRHKILTAEKVFRVLTGKNSAAATATAAATAAITSAETAANKKMLSDLQAQLAEANKQLAIALAENEKLRQQLNLPATITAASSATADSSQAKK